MKVLKFGGTSVGSTESIKQVIDIIKQYHSTGQSITVVFSAMSQVTNKLTAMSLLASESNESYFSILKEIETMHFDVIDALIDIKYQSSVKASIKILLNELEGLLHGVYLIKEISFRTQDLIISFGERLSTFVLTECAKQYIPSIEFTDSRNLIKTDNNFGNAKVDLAKTNVLIQKHFENTDKIQFITGFIASTDKNETTTLGRGGSDFSAALIGAALNCAEIEIWTDVDGIMTADPKIVKKAFTLPTVSYVEALELSHFGAKVIYPPTLQPAFAKSIPIRIKNTFNPSFEGTLISSLSGESNYTIKGISSIKEVSLINLQGSGMMGETGFSGRLFTTLAKNKINIVLITQASSEYSISFAITPSDSNKAKQIIESEFENELNSGTLEPLIIDTNVSIIAVIGENMRKTPGISAKLFGALGRNGVNVIAIAQGSSEYNVSVVVPRSDLSKSLNALHEAFFLSGTKSLNLYIVGLGLIGATLIKQIKNQELYLQNNKSLRINIIGLANSKKMVFNPSGVDLTNWQAELENGKATNLTDFVNQIKDLNLSNSVFIDNTSNKEVILHYENLLKSSISIVTPNKLANSGTFEQYRRLHQAAKLRGVEFLYETNVGAGLPIIGTLKDLLNSGDQIISIEAVLSGTLSFIFNTFKDGVPFSDVVKIAKEKGFTEPDPRDDLNGMDVARKILILARDSGYMLEPSDVTVENILPQACCDAKTVEDFFVELEKANAYFENKRKAAEDKGMVLRFIARLENGKASVNLNEVDAKHPFYSLSGSDNIISFTTERYKERQLVVKGPGAGAEVTAAGVFADIIKVGSLLG